MIVKTQRLEEVIDIETAGDGHLALLTQAYLVANGHAYDLAKVPVSKSLMQNATGR